MLFQIKKELKIILQETPVKVSPCPSKIFCFQKTFDVKKIDFLDDRNKNIGEIFSAKLFCSKVKIVIQDYCCYIAKLLANDFS